MQESRSLHTLHLKNDQTQAYLIGGFDEKYNQVKTCLKYDLLNLNTTKFADLIEARSRAGVVETKSSLFVFGGFRDSVIFLDQIEQLLPQSSIFV